MIVLHILMGVLMVAAGVFHFVKPDFYKPIIPIFLNRTLANIGAGVAEIATGILLFIPELRWLGGLCFFVLMILFLPLHVWDIFREKPAMKTRTAALVRLIVQFGLIYYGFVVWNS